MKSKHTPKVIWLTGLSGAGKTTLAKQVQWQLEIKGRSSIVLDGDELRAGINKNLGYSMSDRLENIRRVAEISRLFLAQKYVVIVATISPLKLMRELAREIVGVEYFHEVYINTPLEVCEGRDVKGLYSKARNGDLPNFTGIHSEYEVPGSEVIQIATEGRTREECAAMLMEII